MSFENEIKEALMKHADDVKPRTESWGEVEGKVRKVHQRRMVGVTALVVALVAAAGVTVPRLLSDDTRPGGFAGPGDSPGPTVPIDDRVTFRHEMDGYQLKMPADWRIAGFEGSTELLPPGQIGLTAGEDTFAVELFVFPGERYDARAGESVTVAGLPAIRREAGDYQVFYRVDWTDVCGYCDDAATLQIQVFASNATLWDSFIADGVDVVESIETTAGLPEGEVRTPRGMVADDVTYDERTAHLVRFMEARVWGSGAGAMLSEFARKELKGYKLNGTGDPFQLWQSYVATERAEADANSSEFTVTLETVDVDGNPVTMTETIGIGAGGDGLEVRFIVPNDA